MRILRSGTYLVSTGGSRILRDGWYLRVVVTPGGFVHMPIINILG